MNDIDYWGNKLPKCPHCGRDHAVWDGDNPLEISYDDGGRADIECASCGKEFVCETSVEYRFSTAVSDNAADDREWGPHPAEDEECQLEAT